MTEQYLAIVSCILAVFVFNALTEKRLVRNTFALFLAASLAYGGLL